MCVLKTFREAVQMKKLLFLAMLMSLPVQAANINLPGQTIDAAALAVIHHLDNCTLASYDGHQLVLTRKTGGAAGFMSGMLTPGASADNGGTEFVFEFLQSKDGVEVFAHRDAFHPLDNGLVRRDSVDDGDLQTFLEQVKTATK